MPVDPSVPGSPEWWLIRLGKRLSAQRKNAELLEAYHRGDPPLPHGNRKMRDAYQRFQKMARSNFAGLVTEAVLERLAVVGFSTGGGAASESDDAAWQWWQRNSLDADAPLVMRHALVTGLSYVALGERDGRAVATAEDCKQVTHESSPMNRRDVRAALKLYTDDVSGYDKALVALPRGVVYFRAKMAQEGENLWDAARWERDTDEGDESVADNQTRGIVPFVPFWNRPSIDGSTLGEFEDVIDIQDRINTVILDRLVISAMQAYRQRWARGVTPEEFDEFDPGADLMWAVESDQASFGEFQAADIRQILDACQADIRQLAAITRTPPHYLVGELNNVNGETLKATETGLVAKTRERQGQFGESWEAVNRIAGIIEGREVPDDAETLWADPQSHSLAELYDAGVKAVTVGESWKQRMRLLGHTPQRIAQIESERLEEAMMDELLNPTPVAQEQPVEDSAGAAVDQ